MIKVHSSIPIFLLCVFACSSSIGAETRELIMVHRGNLLIWNGSSIEIFKASPDLLSEFNISPSDIQESLAKPQPQEHLSMMVQSWLARVSESSRNRPAPAFLTHQTSSDPLPNTPLPLPVIPSRIASTQLYKAYKSETHDNQAMEISGLITKILDNKNGSFTVMMDDWIKFRLVSSSRPKSRDVSGHPKEIEDYVLGRSGIIKGTIRGLDGDGFLIVD